MVLALSAAILVLSRGALLRRTPAVTEALIALLALALGLAAGILWARGRLLARLHTAEAALGAEQARREAEQAAHAKALEDQRRLLEASRKQLEDAFGNLSKAALRDNNQMFLQQAEEKLKPLKETLGKLEERTREIERSRTQAYSGLMKHLGLLEEQTRALQSSSQSLSAVLRGSSQARGRWGETTLRNVAELAGMSRHCDFDEQSVQDGGRPDMVVRLPGGGRIPVDAKAPLSAYYEMSRETDPDRRRELLRKHAADLRGHIQALARRDYTAALQGRVDFTVLFLPAEPLLGAAFEASPDLQEEALGHRVLLTTPATLVALLRTVALY